jgi:hypothetical protein
MSDIFEISLRWQDGAIQCLIYGVVIVAFCWILSKIELKGGGESPTQQEKGKE